MTPNLLDELEKIVALSEKATPGKVELHTSCSWRRIVAERGRPFLVPTIDPDRHQNMDTIESAEFVVALVNWFRTHHAEIAAAVRDAKAYRQLVAGIDAEQLVAASEKHGDALGVLKDAARYRYIKSAPAGTVRADFHSWAPSYHHWGKGKSLDDSIDPAMRAGEGEG